MHKWTYQAIQLEPKWYLTSCSTCTLLCSVRAAMQASYGRLTASSTRNTRSRPPAEGSAIREEGAMLLHRYYYSPKDCYLVADERELQPTEKFVWCSPES